MEGGRRHSFPTAMQRHSNRGPAVAARARHRAGSSHLRYERVGDVLVELAPPQPRDNGLYCHRVDRLH